MCKILIVLDLDNTLILGKEKPHSIQKNPDMKMVEYDIWFRPDAKEFIKKLQKYFLVAVWTAATHEYATLICKELFDVPPIFMFTRKNCDTICVRTGTFARQTTIKQLSKIDYPIHRILILDDTPDTYSQNEENAIHIKKWLDPDEKDRDDILDIVGEDIFKLFLNYDGSVLNRYRYNGWLYV